MPETHSYHVLTERPFNDIVLDMYSFTYTGYIIIYFVKYFSISYTGYEFIGMQQHKFFK